MKRGILLWALELTFVLDVLSKWAVSTYYTLGESVSFFPGLAFTYVRNPGLPFPSLRRGRPSSASPFSSSSRSQLCTTLGNTGRVLPRQTA